MNHIQCMQIIHLQFNATDAVFHIFDCQCIPSNVLKLCIFDRPPERSSNSWFTTSQTQCCRIINFQYITRKMSNYLFSLRHLQCPQITDCDTFTTCIFKSTATTHSCECVHSYIYWHIHSLLHTIHWQKALNPILHTHIPQITYNYTYMSRTLQL